MKKRIKKEKLLDGIELMKINSIEMSNLYFYPIWSNQCKKLCFDGFVTLNFFQQIADFCDCSGII